MNAPVETLLKVPANGTYNLKVKVTADKDTDYVILCDNRRWYQEDTVKAGEIKEHDFTVNVCDNHQFGKEYVQVEMLTVGVMGEVNYSCSYTPCDAPTLYIAGDSTVADQKAEYPYEPAATYCGWGQMFPLYLKNGLGLSNHAQSGLTTADFKQANWQVVKKRIKPGDFLIVEFGHNDQKKADLPANGGYRENLIYYVTEARKLGATPILCSPINRILFEEDGKLINLLGTYRDAVKKVAEEMQVPFIDLWSRTTEYMEAAGPEDAWDYFWGNGTSRDYTHTNDIGGKLIAKFVAQEIKKASVPGISEFITDSPLDTPLPKPTGKKNLAKNLNDYRTIGLVNLPELDKDITGN